MTHGATRTPALARRAICFFTGAARSETNAAGRRPIVPLRGFLLAAVPALLLLLVGGCGKQSVATVNGDEITRDDLYTRTLNYSGGTRQGPAAGLQILDSMINERLLLQEAKREGAVPTEAELDQRLNLIRKQLQEQGTNMDQQLQQAGLTPASIRHDMQVSLAQEKLYTKGIVVTDADVQKFYNDHKNQEFTTPAQVTLRMMTLPSEKVAADARKDLKNADFGLVALSRSIDMFKDRGGLVGPAPLDPRLVPQGGPVPPEAVRKAATMKKGQTSDPFKVGNQWIIIKVDDVTPKKTRAFDEVKELIREVLLQQKAQQSGQVERVQQRMAQLRQQAKIDVKIEQYKNNAIFRAAPALGVPGLPGAAPGAAPGTAPIPPSPPAGTPPAGAPPAAPPAGAPPLATPPAGGTPPAPPAGGK